MRTLLILGFALASERNPNQPLGGSRNVISVKSATDFCMFLPPLPNMSISESEGYPLASPEETKKWAVSHCTQLNPDAPQHQYFYDGFITGAHFKKTDTQVQVTGTIDATKAALIMDGGGFYDFDQNVNSPPGGICAGYDSFYNMVNPIDGIFCIKCCKGIDACQIYNWQQGCAGMVPGDYSPGFDGAAPPNHGRTLTNNVVPPNQDAVVPPTPAGSVGAASVVPPASQAATATVAGSVSPSATTTKTSNAVQPAGLFLAMLTAIVVSN